MATAMTKDDQVLSTPSDVHLDTYGTGRIEAYRAHWSTSQMQWTNAGWNQTNANWVNGDSNYDGFIDITDLGILATNWQLGVGSPLGAESFNEALATVGLGGVTVPEPATFGLIGLALGALATRRRRRGA